MWKHGIGGKLILCPGAMVTHICFQNKLSLILRGIKVVALSKQSV